MKVNACECDVDNHGTTDRGIEQSHVKDDATLTERRGTVRVGAPVFAIHVE